MAITTTDFTNNLFTIPQWVAPGATSAYNTLINEIDKLNGVPEKTFPNTPEGSVAYLNTFLPTEDSGLGGSRNKPEVAPAAGSRGKRPVNAKEPSGKKSKALTPNESYNQWSVSGLAYQRANTSLYQQFATQGVELGRPTTTTRRGYITGTSAG